MSALSIFVLACAGSALVLTQSSIAAPLRDAIQARADETSDGSRRARWWALAAKLVRCPMCAGFWLGLAWGAYLFGLGRTLPAYGFAGSIVSALAVALWLYLDNATPWAPPPPDDDPDA